MRKIRVEEKEARKAIKNLDERAAEIDGNQEACFFDMVYVMKLLALVMRKMYHIYDDV